MSSAATIPPLTATITVDTPVERAFRVFTDAFGSWWPADYHIGQADNQPGLTPPIRVHHLRVGRVHQLAFRLLLEPIELSASTSKRNSP